MADYFTVSGDPVANAAGESAAIRAEFASIATGFTKIAAYTGNASKIVAINSAGTAQEAITTTGTGSGVRATSPTLVTPLLGTPTSGVLTNCTGYPASGLAGLGTGVATFLATPSSANLAAAVTDETGSGLLVFATTPTLVTPILGVATATSINKVAITAPATSATLTIADGKTLTASNTLTFAGTDGSTLNVGTGGTLGAFALKGLTDQINLSANGAINDARANIAMHATTMDLFAGPAVLVGTGIAVTMTNFAGGAQAGAKRTLIPIVGTIITDGAIFDVDGDASYTTLAGDRVVFEATAATTCKVHITKADGTAVVALTAFVSGRVVRTAGDITTTSTSLVDVTGATVTFTTGANPVSVGWALMWASSALDNSVTFNIMVDAALELGTSGVNDHTMNVTQYRNGSMSHQTAALTAASHTIKMQWKTSANTATIKADTANSFSYWAHEVA